MCFDGQLWARLDTAKFYRDIPAKGLIKIITAAGPFVKDLNLRGCIQLWESWRASGLLDACRNLENVSLEGCRIDRNSIHSLLHQNARLQHVNLSGLTTVSNSTMRIIAQHCPNLTLLNISWCSNVDAKGLGCVVHACPRLADLRAGEVRGFDDEPLLAALFRHNALERLVLPNCASLTDASLRTLFTGPSPDLDCITQRALVPPRALRHLDLSRCSALTAAGLAHLAHNVPHLEGLQLSKCHELTDAALIPLAPTLLALTHLDLEECDRLTDAALVTLSRSPARATLQHLSVSYCDALGDAGMLPLLRECRQLRSLDLDNTRVSDLVLVEATAMVRARNAAAAAMTHTPASSTSLSLPLLPSQMRNTTIAPALAASTAPPVALTGLKLVVYDCQNITWTGIREVLSHNAAAAQDPSSDVPREIIALKVFHTYQPTVSEHTRRVLRGDAAAASRLERKWAEYMMASEEAAAGAPGFGRGLDGYGNRRRTRRAREAGVRANEEEGAWARGARRMGGGACAVM